MKFKILFFEPPISTLDDIKLSRSNGLDVTVKDNSYNDLLNKLKTPSLFFSNTISDMHGKTRPEMILKNFFCLEAQHQNDFTGGLATVKMVADYFDGMQKQNFCRAPIADKAIWNEINQTQEMVLAKQLNTPESDGSDIPDLRNGLMKMGISVFDDNGLSDKEHNEVSLISHKNFLWEKMNQILRLGIPIILNMQDQTGCGHFEVVIGMDAHAKEGHIILAKPGAAVIGNLEFEYISKDAFIARWKNMGGEFHGRFMILSPNEPTTRTIDTILTEVPHCKNGEEVKRPLTNLKSGF